MKVLVSVKNVTISLDSEMPEQYVNGVRKVLEALCWVIRGVDQSGQWRTFQENVQSSALILKRNLQKEILRDG